jgi:hypothetical protein
MRDLQSVAAPPWSSGQDACLSRRRSPVRIRLGVFFLPLAKGVETARDSGSGPVKQRSVVALNLVPPLGEPGIKAWGMPLAGTRSRSPPRRSGSERSRPLSQYERDVRKSVVG